MISGRLLPSILVGKENPRLKKTGISCISLLHFWAPYAKIAFVTADMAELADALDSGSSGFTAMEVQVLLSAPATAPGKHDVYREFLFL